MKTLSIMNGTPAPVGGRTDSGIRQLAIAIMFGKIVASAAFREPGVMIAMLCHVSAKVLQFSEHVFELRGSARTKL